MPSYPFAAKRLCVDTDYFEIYNRDNVTLVDLRETGIERIVEQRHAADRRLAASSSTS